jgi:NAD-dependent SIR2 family protein deacetylase
MSKCKSHWQSSKRNACRQARIGYDECKNCKHSVVAGSGDLEMQDMVKRDIVWHGRRENSTHLGYMSKACKLCCTCFLYFCGPVGSKSKGEMV